MLSAPRERTIPEQGVEIFQHPPDRISKPTAINSTTPQPRTFSCPIVQRVPVPNTFPYGGRSGEREICADNGDIRSLRWCFCRVYCRRCRSQADGLHDGTKINSYAFVNFHHTHSHSPTIAVTSSQFHQHHIPRQTSSYKFDTRNSIILPLCAPRTATPVLFRSINL